MKHFGMYLFAASALMLGAMAFDSSAEISNPAQKAIRPLVSFVGADTRIAEHAQHRFTDENSWVKFWLRHTGQSGVPHDYNKYRRSGAPEINFDECMVIAVTESPGQLNAGIVAVAVTETADQITFDYDNMYYQAHVDTSAPGNAFGFFVLPKSNKPVVLRHNVQTGRSRYTGGPPVWKEVKRFPAQINVTVKPHTPATQPPPVSLDSSTPPGENSWNIVFAHDPGSGHYDGIVGRANDTWNFVKVGTTYIESLRNNTGQESPITLKVSEHDGAWGIPEHAGVFHGYIYDNCRCVDLQARLLGVPRGRYKIYVFAHGDTPNQNADVELTVGNESHGKKTTLNVGTWNFRSRGLVDGVQFVSFELEQTADEPIVITSHRAGSDYSMLNAIQLVKRPPVRVIRN